MNNFDYTPGTSYESFMNETPPSPEKKGHAKGYAITALCLGIASLVFACCCCCLYYIIPVLSIIAIVMACLSKRDNGGKMSGMAITGLVLAIIGLVIFLFLIVGEIFLSSNADMVLEMLDETFMEEYGMTFEEYFEHEVGMSLDEYMRMISGEAE